MTYEQQIELLRNLSPQAFQAFGMGQVAYIKPVLVDRKNIFVLYAADGTELTLVDSLQGACHLARQNDLDPVVVH